MPKGVGALFIKNGETPVTAIITGESNTTAQQFAKREHFDAVFYKAKDKTIALDYILKKHGLKAEEVLFCFDDILDLSMAKLVGVRYLINRTSNPAFAEYCKKNNLADYRSASSGDAHALREVTELSLSLLDLFETTTENRIAFSKSYTQFWDKRQKQETKFFTTNNNKQIQEVENNIS